MARTTARRKRSLKHGKSRGRGLAGLPRGLALAVLLLTGVGLAAWYYRLIPRSETPAVSAPAPKAAGKAAKPAPGKGAAEPDQGAAESADRFEFYDMLPDAKVNVPEQARSTRSAGPPPITVPGTYVVQAGAFPNFAEADKVKARLALLGIVSEIQAADANGARFHRVRIGPVENLAELNRLRARLRQNGIEFLVIPVGE